MGDHPSMSESESIYDSEQYDSEQGEVFDEEFAPDADGEADPEAEDEYDSFVEEQGQVKAPWPSLSASWQRRPQATQ